MPDISPTDSVPGVLPGAADDGWGGVIAGRISTGPTIAGSVDSYHLGPSGPTSFGSGGGADASSGSGDTVGTAADCSKDGSDCDRFLIVPRGYVSGTFLSDSATYSGKTFATLGVTPGTYVWTWGTGANQNFTLQIGPAGVPRGGSAGSSVGFLWVGWSDGRRERPLRRGRTSSKS